MREGLQALVALQVCVTLMGLPSLVSEGRAPVRPAAFYAAVQPHNVPSTLISSAARTAACPSRPRATQPAPHLPT